MIGALLLSLLSGLLAALACLLIGYGIWVALIVYSVAGMTCLVLFPLVRKAIGKTRKSAPRESKLTM
ncbi:hypothetical protein SAMN05444358_11013 [Ruegeria halocynthiae]|uniref:Uncharacterized protein n=1 Tax=Ruegeria halocynthiae TaxID=985054 RepID=A0A1H3E1A3_9RHOB|nr:hypothetical protein SAMN05444358_11013 [Ruegeria halocynthiae]